MASDLPLILRSDTLVARILPRGATLADLRFAGSDHGLILGFADPANHHRIPIYAGAIVGPVANRISGGRITLEGATYRMPRNENNKTCLHSGDAGLHARDWKVATLSDTAVGLEVTLPDGEYGLPGHRQIRAEYSLSGQTMTLHLTAQSDRSTPINIAAHPYWALDSGAGIAGHRLRINAAHYLPTDTDNLPTGQITPVADTEFDFRSPRLLAPHPAYDVNFCLQEASQKTPQRAATLIGALGTKLEIATTAPGLQVYTGAFLPPRPGVLQDGGDLRAYAGIALEPQFWPNAPQHPHFPDITLRPGDLWQQVTHYRLIPPDLSATIPPQFGLTPANLFRHGREVGQTDTVWPPIKEQPNGTPRHTRSTSRQTDPSGKRAQTCAQARLYGLRQSLSRKESDFAALL